MRTAWGNVRMCAPAITRARGCTEVQSTAQFGGCIRCARCGEKTHISHRYLNACTRKARRAEMHTSSVEYNDLVVTSMGGHGSEHCCTVCAQAQLRGHLCQSIGDHLGRVRICPCTVQHTGTTHGWSERRTDATWNARVCRAVVRPCTLRHADATRARTVGGKYSTPPGRMSATVCGKHTCHAYVSGRHD